MSADLIDRELEHVYTVAEWDLVTFFAERFPEDEFETAPVVTSAILMLWGERLCMQVLGFSFGFHLEFTHCNFALLGDEVKVWVKCKEWRGKLTDWDYLATCGDIIVARGVLTMAKMSKAAFERKMQARMAATVPG